VNGRPSFASWQITNVYCGSEKRSDSMEYYFQRNVTKSSEFIHIRLKTGMKLTNVSFNIFLKYKRSLRGKVLWITVYTKLSYHSQQKPADITAVKTHSWPIQQNHCTSLHTRLNSWPPNNTSCIVCAAKTLLPPRLSVHSADLITMNIARITMNVLWMTMNIFKWLQYFYWC